MCVYIQYPKYPTTMEMSIVISKKKKIFIFFYAWTQIVQMY